MNAENQFWWNWWVSLGAAIATVMAVVVALFGERMKARFFPPKLSLTLRNPTGERTSLIRSWHTEQGLQQQTEDARYYHVKVSNQASWPSANQTQVYLLRIEEPGPGGVLQITWSGELPVQWTHQAVFPLARTIGPAAYCDLCSVIKDSSIQLHPMIFPTNFFAPKTGATTLVVSLQAKSNEGESAIARFQIAWDGKWEDGDTEMARHLVIKDVTEKA